MDLFYDSRNYRPDEVAALLRVSTRTVRNYCNDPSDPLPSMRLGNSSKGRLVIPGKSANDWIARRKVKPWQ